MICRGILCRGVVCCAATLAFHAILWAQFPGGNPLPGTIPPSSLSLVLEDVIRIPDHRGQAARLELLYHRGDGSGRLDVADQHGRLYSFLPGDEQPELLLDLPAHIPDFVDGAQNGLRSFAFHPDHIRPGTAGFGKLYTAHSVQHQGAELADHDSVVAEWTLDPDGSVDTASLREVLRVAQPRGDHNIGRIGFRPAVDPTHSDFGNLYIAMADGANHRPPGDAQLNPNAQDRTNRLGSILRINPLADPETGAPWRVPNDNPFVDQADVRPEIWAYGLRNPHQFSWDTGGIGTMLIVDIGQSNIEELNVGIAGANYGWPLREGTFDVEGKAPLIPMQVEPLPQDHPTDPFTYPAAQYDHVMENESFRNGSTAIAGGFVYRGNRLPLLDGVYLFGEFAFSDGPIYALDVDQLMVRDDFANLEELHEGRLTPIAEVSLIYQGQEMTLLEIIRRASGDDQLQRTDLRFGQGEDGELFILNKHDGWVRQIVAVPEPSGCVLLFASIGAMLLGRRARAVTPWDLVPS